MVGEVDDDDDCETGCKSGVTGDDCGRDGHRC